jgi:hypothetical protein
MENHKMQENPSVSEILEIEQWAYELIENRW